MWSCFEVKWQGRSVKCGVVPWIFLCFVCVLDCLGEEAYVFFVFLKWSGSRCGRMDCLEVWWWWWLGYSRTACWRWSLWRRRRKRWCGRHEGVRMTVPSLSHTPSYIPTSRSPLSRPRLFFFSLSLSTSTRESFFVVPLPPVPPSLSLSRPLLAPPSFPLSLSVCRPPYTHTHTLSRLPIRPPLSSSLSPPSHLLPGEVTGRTGYARGHVRGGVGGREGQGVDKWEGHRVGEKN